VGKSWCHIEKRAVVYFQTKPSDLRTSKFRSQGSSFPSVVFSWGNWLQLGVSWWPTSIFLRVEISGPTPKEVPVQEQRMGFAQQKPEVWDEIDHFFHNCNSCSQKSSFRWTISEWIWEKLVGGLEPWNFMTFPSYWEFHHPNWRTHIFQRGRSTTNQ